MQGLPDVQDEETSIEDSLMALEKSAEELVEWDESDDIEDSLNAISSSAAESQSIQSSSLRPALEVDSIPGDKLHATLSEIETSTVNPDGSIRNQSIEGELILRNSSRKDRAWDIEVSLSEFESTDLGNNMVTVRELEATEETVIPYTACLLYTSPSPRD